MKKLILLITVLGISIGCSSDEPKAPLPDIPMELVGKWKITTRTQTTSGSDHTWMDYDSGNTYDIWYKADGTYISMTTNNEDCKTGAYEVNDNYLDKINDLCYEDGSSRLRIDSLTNQTLEVFFTSAIEGASLRYKKVEE